MAVLHANSVLGFIRELAETETTRKLVDRELLARFVRQGDQTAFKALVRRHGPMVFRLCQRVLRSEQDAEDVFQATFLVLAKKAHALQRPESIGSWLFGVASRLASNMKKSTARRRSRESQASEKQPGDPLAEISVREAQEVLDEELSRLQEKYQAPFVLCCLEGMTRDEAARQLGLSVGTLRSRLEQARELLRTRLARRGLTVTGALLASVLSGQAACAAMPPVLVYSTVKAAMIVAAGGAATVVVSAKVAALTEGVLKTMFVSKLKIGAAVLLVVGLFGIGVGHNGNVVPTATLAAQDNGQSRYTKQKAPHPPGDPAKDKDALQGLWRVVAVDRDGKNTMSPAEVVQQSFLRIKGDKLVFNPGAENWEHTIRKLDSNAKPKAMDLYQTHDSERLGLQELQTIYELDGDHLKICLDFTNRQQRPTEFKTKAGESRQSITYERVKEASDKAQPKTQQKDGADNKDPTEVKKQEQDKEAFTAWGNEVGGMQAGLGFRPGQKRAYSHGETVKLVVRVRNVGKEAVDFKYIWAFFVENPPTITDADGKLVQLPRGRAEGRQLPRSTNVVPGKEVELYESEFDLRPKGESSNKNLFTIHGTGKFSLQCGRIVGPSSGNPEDPNPAMNKLATGKLELEVNDAEKLPEKRETLKLEAPVRYMRWSQDGTLMASFIGREFERPEAKKDPKEASFRIWDAKTGKLKLSLDQTKNDPGTQWFGFSPDGKYLAISTRRQIEEGDIIELYDVNKGERLTTIEMEYARSRVYSAFSPDSRTIAVCGSEIKDAKLEGAVRLFDAMTGELKKKLIAGSMTTSVAFSSDGKLVAAGGHQGDITIWDPATGKISKVLDAQKQIQALAFSPDSKQLVSVGGDAHVKLWDCRTGKSKELTGSAGQMFAEGLAFSADGRFVAAESPDEKDVKRVTGTVHVWDAHNGKLVREWTGTLRSFAFSPDSKRLAILHDPKTIKVYDLRGARKENDPRPEEKGQAKEPKQEPQLAILEEIEKHGGIVERDEKAPGKPVIMVKVHWPGEPAGKLDDSFVERLASLTKLRKLHIGGQNISDEGVKSLLKFKELEFLDLAFTNTTDVGLKHLEGVKTLQTVRVSFAGVTEQGIVALQEALPKAKIIRR